MDKKDPESTHDFANRVLDLLPDPIFVKDSEHRWILINDAFCRFLGRTREELLGKSDYDFFSKEEADHFWAKDKMVFEAGTVDETEETLTDEANVRHTIATKKAPFTTDSGERFLVGVIRDLTARRHLEAQLVDAERLASVGSLAAGVAHEVNNPLTYVTVNLSLAIEQLRSLGDTRTLRDVNACLEDALDGARRVARIVEDLRCLARPSQDTSETANIGSALDAATRMLTVLTRNRATVRVEPFDWPAVHCSESRLSQVFINLIANATKAFVDDDPQQNLITVTAKVDGERVRVVIADNGPGMNAELLRRVLEPFVSGRRDGGMGLGLSISHTIVMSFGGTLHLESELGKGTRAIVELAIHRETPQAAKSIPRILVVDDEPMVLRAFARMLEPEMSVSVAHSRDEALACIESLDGAFDAVVCDIRMPGGSGVDLYENVRERWPTIATHFLFITGGTAHSAMEGAVRATGCPVLAKPFSTDAARAAVRDVLRLTA